MTPRILNNEAQYNASTLGRRRIAKGTALLLIHRIPPPAPGCDGLGLKCGSQSAARIKIPFQRWVTIMGNDPRTHDSPVIPIRGWKIRFDSPPTSSLSYRAETGDILGLFQAWQGATREGERRRSPRHVPAETSAWVGWWKGTRFFVSRAELVNLSEGGALLCLSRRPPSTQSLWVCLGAPRPTVLLEARTLEAIPGTEGLYNTRVEFQSPCPPHVFLDARQDSHDSHKPLPDETGES
ncbi:MAG: hypothetical protein NVSMB9_24820 [Isosphaeraceae bacterium]